MAAGRYEDSGQQLSSSRLDLITWNLHTIVLIQVVALKSVSVSVLVSVPLEAQKLVVQGVPKIMQQSFGPIYCVMIIQEGWDWHLSQ